MVPVRSCLVSFTDTEGIEHSVRIPAESLYEAAIEAMAAFKRGVFAEMPFGPTTRLSAGRGTHDHGGQDSFVPGGRRPKSQRRSEEESLARTVKNVKDAGVRMAAAGGNL